MSQSVLVFGRQPQLGLAEAESLFGAHAILSTSTEAAVIDIAPDDLSFSRLGGSTRLAKLLTYLPFTDWDKIEQYLAQELPKHTCCLPEGKIKLGLSAFGLRVTPRKLNATGLSLKKAVKNPPTGEGRSSRIVPNNNLELNTAQIIYNQLLGPTGMELLLIRDGDRTVLAQTIQVQDIQAYAARDQARPARDARVGMLPPKLAQIITNLAVGQAKDSRAKILDPFCGTGVLLQEALLMGNDAIGTDLEPRMIEYSQINLDWLAKTYALEPDSYSLQVGDATSHQWQSFDVIAGETYLGRPLSTAPKPDTLREIMQDVDVIHRKFLLNVANQTKPGFRMCIAVPAWFTKSGVKHLKVLENLDNLGYTRMSFVHVDTRDLIYHRENQVVGRELVTLIRK